MVAAIERGERLACEPTIPEFIQQTMVGCWHELPKKRASFERLNDSLLVTTKVLAAQARTAESGWQLPTTSGDDIGIKTVASGTIVHAPGYSSYSEMWADSSHDHGSGRDPELEPAPAPTAGCNADLKEIDATANEADPSLAMQLNPAYQPFVGSRPEPFEHPEQPPEPGLAMRLNPAYQPFERPTGTETDPGRGRLASVYNGFDDADPEA